MPYDKWIIRYHGYPLTVFCCYLPWRQEVVLLKSDCANSLSKELFWVSLSFMVESKCWRTESWQQALCLRLILWFKREMTQKGCAWLFYYPLIYKISAVLHTCIWAHCKVLELLFLSPTQQDYFLPLWDYAQSFLSRRKV